MHVRMEFEDEEVRAKMVAEWQERERQLRLAQQDASARFAGSAARKMWGKAQTGIVAAAEITRLQSEAKLKAQRDTQSESLPVTGGWVTVNHWLLEGLARVEDTRATCEFESLLATLTVCVVGSQQSPDFVEDQLGMVQEKLKVYYNIYMEGCSARDVPLYLTRFFEVVGRHYQVPHLVSGSLLQLCLQQARRSRASAGGSAAWEWVWPILASPDVAAAKLLRQYLQQPQITLQVVPKETRSTRVARQHVRAYRSSEQLSLSTLSSSTAAAAGFHIGDHEGRRSLHSSRQGSLYDPSYHASPDRGEAGGEGDMRLMQLVAGYGQEDDVAGHDWMDETIGPPPGRCRDGRLSLPGACFSRQAPLSPVPPAFVQQKGEREVIEDTMRSLVSEWHARG